MKILLTGGAGYVGSHVSALLHSQNIEHTVFDDLSTGHREMIEGREFIKGDIADAKQLKAAFASCKPDMVIHLAALATLGDCQKRPDDCTRINILGTRNVLDSMRAHGVRYIVMASSCAVYAPVQKPMMLSEKTSPIAPTSLYGESKLEGERLVKEYSAAHGIGHILLRIFNVSGADPGGAIGELHNPETHLVPLAIEAALGKRPGLHIYGDDYPTPDGTAVRDYIHVCDVASACLHGAHYLQKGGASQAVNLGSGIGTSVRQLLDAVSRHVGKPVPADIQGRREGDTPYLVSDVRYMSEVLGWQPKMSDIDTVVTTALRFHRGQ